MPKVDIEPRGKPRGEVTFAMPHEALQGLPPHEIYRDRTLVAQTAIGEIGVTVEALPSRTRTITPFWTIIGEQYGIDVKPEAPQAEQDLRGARLRIESPINPLAQVWGEHTPISVTNPYVVMEDGTRYGIGLLLPPDSFSDWSEQRERTIGFRRQEYRQRKGISVLIRVNGDTPLTERVINDGRTEVYRSINPPANLDERSGHLIASRMVDDKTKPASTSPDVDSREGEIDVYDLEFTKVADRGTAKNAAVDNQGLVEVIVVRTTEEEIKETDLLIKTIEKLKGGPTPDTGPSPQIYESPSLKRDGSGPHQNFATEKGKVTFSAPRVEKVSYGRQIQGEPVAVFRFALVGDGGPITTEMTPANMEQ